MITTIKLRKVKKCDMDQYLVTYHKCNEAINLNSKYKFINENCYCVVKNEN